MPVVGRIPVVGRLFSNRTYIQANTETIVLITPTVVRNDKAAVDAATRDRIEAIAGSQDEHIESLDEEMDTFFGTH